MVGVLVFGLALQVGTLDRLRRPDDQDDILVQLPNDGESMGQA